MFDSNRVELHRVLVQLAFADDSCASKAVLHAILALSSLYRDGETSTTAEYKLASLDLLMFSLESSVSRTGAIMHIAAGVLLCNLEVRNLNCS